MERIGIIGLGRMGRALVRRFAGAGQPVDGWTRSGATDGLGIAGAPSLAALADQSDVLILSLFDDAAVADILGQLSALDLGGRLILDTSTVSPTLLKAHAAALADAGAEAADAPISGGPEMVEAGTCGIFLGAAPGTADRARAVLSQVTERLFHTGPMGTGMGMKIANNAVLQGYMAAVRESLQIAKRAGVEFETALRVIAGGPAGTPMLKDRLAKALGADPEVGFTIAGVRKDSAVFVDAAEALGLDAPILLHARKGMDAAISDGLAEADVAHLARHAWDAV